MMTDGMEHQEHVGHHHAHLNGPCMMQGAAEDAAA